MEESTLDLFRVTSHKTDEPNSDLKKFVGLQEKEQKEKNTPPNCYCDQCAGVYVPMRTIIIDGEVIQTENTRGSRV